MFRGMLGLLARLVFRARPAWPVTLERWVRPVRLLATGKRATGPAVTALRSVSTCPGARSRSAPIRASETQEIALSGRAVRFREASGSVRPNTSARAVSAAPLERQVRLVRQEAQGVEENGPGGTAGAAGSTACGDCVFNVAFGGSSCPAESQNCLNNPGCTELLKCAYDTGCLSSSTPIQCAIQVGCGGDDPQSAQLARQVLDCAVCNAGCGSVCPPPPNGCGTGGAAGSAGSAGSAGAGGFATCDDCVADPSTSDFCQGPLNDCLNDMQCNGLINCLNACTDQACYDNCAMQFAGGLDLYNGAVQCFYCTQCSSLCDAQYPGVCN